MVTDLKSYGVSPAIWITHLPPNIGKPQPDRPVLDLPTSEGRKAEMTLVTLRWPWCWLFAKMV